MYASGICLNATVSYFDENNISISALIDGSQFVLTDGKLALYIIR